MRREDLRELSVQLEDRVVADDGSDCGGSLATAIGLYDDVGREHRLQRLEVAVARGCEKRRSNLHAALLRERVAGPRRADVFARTHSELPNRARFALESLGDLC